jgi:hypothetical protein
MRKLILLIPILLITSCASLNFQVRTLNTASLYNDYYNPTPFTNSNFIFFQPNYHNDFWWNYSQTFPYNWNHFGSFGLTYNWRYNRWNSNQWLINPYYNQFRIAPLRTPNIVRNRGTVNTRVTVPTPPRGWRTTTNIEQRRNNISIQPSRGRSNQQVRQPQYVRPSQPRVQQPIRRTQSPIRQQQTPKTTRGGVIIKQ